jgi:hypothetical protein
LEVYEGKKEREERKNDPVYGMMPTMTDAGRF